MQWGIAHLHYSSVLDSTGSRVTIQQSLHKHDSPKVEGSSIFWRDGVWRSDSIAVRDTIFRNEHGSVEWHCLMPRARARFRNRFGFGYAEHLTVTIPPWKLPIETLRWGRFTSAYNWVVWIDWQGEFPRRVVYWNGTLVPILAVEDEEIRFEGGALLTMDRSLVLRDGHLGTTVLATIPGIGKILPTRLRQVYETKWRSRARLQSPGGLTIDGWVIHERVSWPK